MSTLCRDVTNAIWHAFDALDDKKCGKVMKSRLTVLTASLGTLLECTGVEKGLSEHLSTPYLTFNDYMFYLQKELFASFSGSMNIRSLRHYHDQIEDMCWLVCKHQYETIKDFISFPDTTAFLLFRIFCLLGELNSSKEQPAVVMNAEEAQLIVCSFVQTLGLECDQVELEQISTVFKTFTFHVFLSLMETRYTQKLEMQAIVEATKELYDTLVKDVIKQGYLKKRISPLGLWWEMWFVLQPHTLSWYSSKDQTEKRGEVSLCPASKEESVSSGAKDSHMILVTSSKTLELNADDCKCKQQWISAFQTAIKFSQSQDSYQRHLAAKRRIIRDEARAKQKEEEDQHLQERLALEAEKQNREAAEAQLIKENQKRKELEDIQEHLKQLLEEERQAKRDEEIVRNLQSRMLAEEWERREQLERQHAEQEKALLSEKLQRKQMEQWQQIKFTEMDQLTQTVATLRREKKNLHGTLQRTKKMLTVAEYASKALESKLKSSACKRTPLQRTLSADLSCVSSGYWMVPVSTCQEETLDKHTRDGLADNSSISTEEE